MLRLFLSGNASRYLSLVSHFRFLILLAESKFSLLFPILLHFIFCIPSAVLLFSSYEFIFVLYKFLHMEAFAEPSFVALSYALDNFYVNIIDISSTVVVFPVYLLFFDKCSFELVQ